MIKTRVKLIVHSKEQLSRLQALLLQNGITLKTYKNHIISYNIFPLFIFIYNAFMTVEDPEPFYIDPEEAELKYIYYSDSANDNEKYHVWYIQKEPSFTLTDFTVLEYNDFLKKLNPPIQRRKQL